MEGTVVSRSISETIKNTERQSEVQTVKASTKSDSMEFVSGILHLAKKVFLLK